MKVTAAEAVKLLELADQMVDRLDARSPRMQDLAGILAQVATAQALERIAVALESLAETTHKRYMEGPA